MDGRVISLITLRSVVLISECIHFTSFVVDMLGLGLCLILVAKVFIGLLRLILPRLLMIYALPRAVFIRQLTVMTVFMVGPYVVLLDNHTTTRIGRT